MTLNTQHGSNPRQLLTEKPLTEKPLTEKLDALLMLPQLYSVQQLSLNQPAFMVSKQEPASSNTFSYFLANPTQLSINAKDINHDSVHGADRSTANTNTHHIPFHSGWVGYYAYPKEPIDINNTESIQSEFHYYPWAICLDHNSGDFHLLGNPDEQAQQLFTELVDQSSAHLEDKTTPSCSAKKQFKAGIFKAYWSKQQYQTAFNKVQEYLHAGDCYQINLTHPHKASYTGSALQTFAPLYKALNPSFGCYFESHDCQLVSVSPERFMSIDASGHLEAKPIKGTIKKSEDPTQDQLYIDELKNSAKNQAENLMIVDLLRNDLSRSAIPNSVNVEKLFELETHPYVHHLVSTISAQLKPNLTPAEAIANAFPGGSITGAPKKRAMEIIAELEAEPRSLYCGSFGYYADSGHADFNILIRSVEFRDGEMTCWGGGGITVDSDCDEEYEESLTKVRKIMEIIEGL